MPPPSNQPDWLQVLAEECDRTSQSTVARRLNVSPAAVSQLLKGTYSADTTRMEDRVRGELMRETVPCPVLGDLGKRQCLDEQAKPYYANPLRSALFKACKSCPYAHRAEGASSKESK